MLPTHSRTHAVLIPSYNPGARALETVDAARRHWSPVWVVVDGSTDGSTRALVERTLGDPGMRCIVLPRNVGKGAAVLVGLRAALADGFTHVLTMDADGQHPADRIPEFMATSQQSPAAMVLGEPEFDAAAPRLRVRGRRVSNGFANLETLWAGVHDSLFGFRVYPVAPLEQIMSRHRWMRRFDFDVEAAVRLCWAGVRPVNVRAPVRYFSREQGGVSHFRYGRDNALLAWMHSRLLFGFLARLPLLVYWRLRRHPPFATAPPSGP